MKKIERSVPEALLREQIKEISLRDIALSNEFRRIIETSVNAVLSAHNRMKQIRFNIDYNPYDPMTACTDNTQCYMNAANEMFETDPLTGEIIPIKESCKRLYGAVFHETGHILYTCFSEMRRMGKLFEKGDLDVPSFKMDKDMQIAYDELKDAMKNEKAAVLQGFDAVPVRYFIFRLYMALMNCIEDARIEQCLINNDNRFSGLYSGLLSLREYHCTAGEQWDMSEQDIPTFTNLCLIYAKYGTMGKYAGGFDEFDKAVPIIDEMVRTHQAMSFAQLNLMLILCIWPKIRDLIMEMSGGPGNGDGQDGEGEKDDSSQGSEGSGSAEGSSEESSSESSSEEGSEGNSSSEGSSEEKSENASKEDSKDTSKSQSRQKQSELEQKLNEVLNELEQNLPKERENQSDGAETEMKENDAVANSAPRDVPSESLESTLGEILKKLADEKVRDNASEEAQKAVKDTIASCGRGFAPYLGTKVITPEPYRYADSLDDATESAVKKAAREIQRHLEQDMRTGVSKRKFSGKKFNAGKVVNRDFRYFEDKTTKKDMPKVKVGLVVDESGSMHSANRYAYARAAAITLYRIFEYVPNLDIAVYGHSTRGEVEIYDYADFGIKPKDVEARLSNISARGGNIDIVPVTAMAENLLKQDADARVMFIITDGLPYSYVRGKTPEEELSEAADKYSRKGIDIIVASIGSDEERLRTIYKNQRFLNISSPSELPKKVVNVIKRKM